ncbi:MAG: hypothetical protein H6668_24985 [Ardenticatenaceae bacterium]|nr:hypothetical protein [Ardenticatenaceae bacterium]
MPARLAQVCAVVGLGESMVGARRPGITPAAPRALPPGRLAQACAVVGLGESMVGARRPGITPAAPRALPPGRLAQACAVVGLGERARRCGDNAVCPRQRLSAPSSPYNTGW